MEYLTMTSIVIGILLLFFVIGMPIAFSLGVAGFIGLLQFYSFDQSLIFASKRLHDYMASFTFTAVPLFILMGYLALYAGFTKNAFDSARLWFASVPGGLGNATVAASAMFAACAGSGLPAAAALGRVAVPEMIAAGYDKRIATGVVAAATPLAVLIPPSIVMIVYGIISETSIGKLLIAGILPGLLAVIVFMLAITVTAVVRPDLMPPIKAGTFRMKLASLRQLWGIGFLFGAAIGSIYFGWATPTEAAAIGASGALILATVTRRIGYRDVIRALVDTAMLTASLFLIIVMSSIFTTFIVRSGAVANVSSWIIGLDLSVVGLMLILSVVFILLGLFLDAVSMIVMTMPVLMPVLQHMDVDLIWFGIIMIIWIEIASITPPFGISVFALKNAVGSSVSLGEIFAGAAAFILVWMVVLGLVIAFPQISLWLPDAMRR